MEFVFCRVNWDKTAAPFHMPGAVRWFDINVAPEPGYPFGRRGLAIAAAWRQLANARCRGMLLMDGDVAIDPLDLAAMGDQIAITPGVVLVGPVRLWPASTMRPDWVWGHWKAGRGAGKGPSQEPCDRPDRFGFSFTYLPRRLLELATAAGLEEWTFPNVDVRVADVARKHRVRARVVGDCHPKHLHY